MEVLDLILNLAFLLLGLKGLSYAPVPRYGLPPRSVFLPVFHRSLRTERWILWALLALAVQVRGLIYWSIGSEMGWVPKLHLGLVAVPFRSDFPLRMLGFSVLSFLYFLLLFFWSLLLLTLLHGRSGSLDPTQRWVEKQLGRISRWPGWVRLLLPAVSMAVFWAVVAPLLWEAGLVPRPAEWRTLLVQSSILGIGAYLQWKYLLVAVLLLHLVNTYIYLKNVTFWNYIDATARKVLRPIRWLPLTVARFDFLPFAGMLLVLLAAQVGARLLGLWYQQWSF